MTVARSAIRRRARTPGETIACVDRWRSTLGITRLANVTGLDYLGIPVFMAIRPNSRSLSLSSGKGIDSESAAASALMEAAEFSLAERPPQTPVLSSRAALSRKARVVDCARLPRVRGSAFDNRCVIGWIEGREICDGSPVYVPWDMAHTDFTVRPSPFLLGSNGLASGNTFSEAVCSALCEVIERDCLALWQARGPGARAARRLRLDTVRVRDARHLIAGLEREAMSLAVWNATSDVGAPCFIARLCEAEGNDRSALGHFWGAGCQLDPGVALLRAITEAAQSRLTVIAGARDDLTAGDYAFARPAGAIAIAIDRWEQMMAGCRFESMASLATATSEGDIAVLLHMLARAGMETAVAVDLSDPRFDIAVVRVVVPGLEAHDTRGQLAPGARKAAA